jgi:hypothetical protein
LITELGHNGLDSNQKSGGLILLSTSMDKGIGHSRSYLSTVSNGSYKKIGWEELSKLCAKACMTVLFKDEFSSFRKLAMPECLGQTLSELFLARLRALKRRKVWGRAP